MTRAKYPAGLGLRGRRLWAEVSELKVNMGPGERVLLEEACRLTDRLDRYAKMLSGEDFARYQLDDSGVYRLDVSNAASEARMTTLALRQTMISLGLDAPRAKGDSPVKGHHGRASTKKGLASGDPLDDLEQRRTARRPGA